MTREYWTQILTSGEYKGYRRFEAEMLADGAVQIQGYGVVYDIDGVYFKSKRAKDRYLRGGRCYDHTRFDSIQEADSWNRGMYGS